MKKMLLLVAALVLTCLKPALRRRTFKARPFVSSSGIRPAARMTCGRDWSDLI